jgi:hypothetical protein
MHRKRVLPAAIGLVCSVLLAGAAFAQEAPGSTAAPVAAPAAEEAKEDARPNSLYPGSWSLQFQIADYVGLEPFNGMIVSVKRHFSERSALRLGFRFDIDWNDEEASSTWEGSGDLNDSRESSQESNYQKITIDLSYLRYVRPGSYVNFFWGAGPLVGFSRTSQTGTNSQENESRETNRYWRSWSVGALGLIGVEWFLQEHFSFHAEYRASFSYGEGYAESHASQTTSSGTLNQQQLEESASWNFESANVILGLSVYF